MMNTRPDKGGMHKKQLIHPWYNTNDILIIIFDLDENIQIYLEYLEL